MKTFVKLVTLFSSVLATLSLAAGLNQVAAKLDPVTKKTTTLSTLETGEVAPLPCAPCINDPE